MAETVTVIAGSGGYDSDGNPLPAGAPVEIRTLGVAPGNTMLKLGVGGDLDDVQYTVYMPLGSPVNNDDTIMVRGKACRARVSEWVSPWTARGGMAVLARAVTGGHD